MSALIFVYIKEKFAHTHAQNAPLESVVLVNTLTRSRAQAVV